MPVKKDENNLDYAEKAVISFHEIMSNNRKDMLEDMNRVNKGELFVLHFLAMRDTAALPSELSVALQASTARISALLGALEKKGQIQRDIDKSNRRNILVTITEAGRVRAESEMKEMHRSMAKIFTDMGEADTAEFIRLLKRVSELAQKHIPCQRDEGDHKKNVNE